MATLDRDLPNGAALERPRRRRRRRSDRDLSYRALAVVTGCVLAFLYVPIATLMIFSFNDNKVMRLPFGDWTLQWYVKAFTNPQLLAAVGNSLIVAVCALAICLVIGIPTALALSRYDFPGKTVFRRLVILPITLPGIITGVSMLSFFSQLGIELSLTTVIIGHGTAFAAIVITSVYARLERFDRRIIEASADLGVTPLRTFWKVTLPNIRTSIIGSSLLVFTLSFDEIPVTFFLTGRDNTLPMYIWSAIRRGITPEINAIGTVIIAVSIILIVVSTAILIQPAERRREQHKAISPDLSPRSRPGCAHDRRSSGSGGWPPSRRSRQRAASMSASALRAAKKSAVFMAETFSATAVATNWLMLVPSSLAICAAASFRDLGSRSG